MDQTAKLRQRVCYPAVPYPAVISLNMSDKKPEDVPKGPDSEVKKGKDKDGHGHGHGHGHGPGGEHGKGGDQCKGGDHGKGGKGGKPGGRGGHS
ncbi:holotricin-3-like [Denticeps clupeoides]|uniref:holotricin-3-like n=1 Tax=Denticeps clupeoides TaxID=299321 RepID=UPI0010A49ED4|nr:holotricin-3-like [Denticeps clupeoides]XP_028853294.1 holotricin-3-like [Denticeps clupeoides]